MEEKYIDIDDAQLYVLKTDIQPHRPTLVCVHGLGESLLCWSEAFRDLEGINIVAMDHAGYGRSRPARSGDHSTLGQAKRVFQVLDALGISRFFLMGHSWGGDIGTTMCQLDSQQRIRFYINVESDIHRDNVMMSHYVSKAFEQLDESQFDTWLKTAGALTDFPEPWTESFAQTLWKWGRPSRAAAIRYLASVRMCTAHVYGQTATEINTHYQAAGPDGILHWGTIYAGLPQPTIYCWGSESIPETSNAIGFLKSKGIATRCFQGASHWLMMDNSKEFYPFVRELIQNADRK